jgi:hypothetical protein
MFALVKTYKLNIEIYKLNYESTNKKYIYINLKNTYRFKSLNFNPSNSKKFNKIKSKTYILTINNNRNLEKVLLYRGGGRFWYITYILLYIYFLNL